MRPSPLLSELKTGILHLGLGAFHRAHQAAFTQDAIAASGGNWGIEAVSMRNPELAQILNDQGGEFTLIERASEGHTLQKINVIKRAHILPGNEAAVAARIADPDIHIVSITVTEKGYAADFGARCLNLTDAAVAHDLTYGPQNPRSLVGLICLGLAARHAADLDGVTLMSCDNISQNGRLLEAITLEFAGRTDPALRDWIKAKCTFPNAMVDRITPAATSDTYALAAGDRGAIETEPFRQWVIEDHFAGPRPDWEKAGVLIVKDVELFEKMKLRMLNGAHSLVAYSGQLLGHEAVRDVMQDSRCAQAVDWHMARVTASLAPLDAFEYATYAQDLIDRFTNRAIDHRCSQIAMDGSQKMPQRIFEPALDLMKQGNSFGSCAFTTALWIRFLEGKDEHGKTLTLNDPMSDDLKTIVAQNRDNDAALVHALGAALGPVAAQLWENRNWQEAVSDALECIRTQGLHRAIMQFRAAH
jgi:fructuronate reductase